MFVREWGKGQNRCISGKKYMDIHHRPAVLRVNTKWLIIFLILDTIKPDLKL